MRIQLFITLAAALLMTGCGATSTSSPTAAATHVIAHWDGSTAADFSLTKQTTVTVASSAAASPDATGPCSMTFSIYSDSGTRDDITATPAKTTKTLVLSAGNWKFGLPTDSNDANELNCSTTGLDVQVTGSS